MRKDRRRRGARGEREREESERRGESVCGERERDIEGRREESGDSGALTQLCVTLRGMCWLGEVVLLSQMTSASLLKTIG